MMYVIYNNDGSIKLSNLNEIITQNSNNVSKIFFAVEGYDTDNYNADATFELSNGDANTLVATISSMTLDTTPYVGWEFSLTNAQTASPGRLLASIELKNLSDVVLFTFPLDLFVNKTTLQPDETTITVAQYNNLRDAMLGKQDKFGLNTLRIYQTMGDANADLSNLVLGQLVYVIAENKLFQVEGSPKALVLTNDNYVKQYPYNETATLQTIYDEVGLNKLFYAKLDNRWQLLMLQETSGNYSFAFWDELGYGETDTTVSLSETINNLTFTYTGYYFPYVEKNSLGGPLTDDELAILSQPNSVFICLGNILHKVDATRFEKIIVSSTGTGGTGILTTLLYITINTSAKTFTFNNSYFSSYSTAGISNLLAQKQDLLINQFNIKSINGQSLLGSGNLDVGGGSGNVEWGNIGGDIADQTDLQNELQKNREIAEGKCKSVVLSYNTTAPTNNSQAQALKKLDGTNFTDLADFNSYVSGLTLRNSVFDSQNDALTYPSNNSYFISSGGVVYRGTDFNDNFKTGDIFIITETLDSQGNTLPDRWLEIYVSGSIEMLSFHKLETSKVDLTNYPTFTDLNNAIASLNANLAGLYDSTLVYAKGQVVIHDNKLYSCTTAISTPEAWNSTHWDLTNVASEFVNLHGSQDIDGEKTFSSNITLRQISGYYTPRIYFGTDKAYFETYQGSSGTGSYLFTITSVPENSSLRFIVRGSGGFKFFVQGGTGNNLGTDSYPWTDLYLTRNLNDGTNSYTIAESMAQFNYSVAGTTVIKWTQFCSFNLSADTTLTLETTKTDCLCEYKANITNSSASAITITLPSGTTIKGNVSISSNTFVIPSGSSVEINILNNRAIVVEW